MGTTTEGGDARELAREEGFDVLCTRDDCAGEVRDGAVAYGWHPDPAERNRRVLRGLEAARQERATRP